VRDRSGIFWEIVSGVHAELSFERVAVWEWQPSTRSFVGVYGIGLPEELVQAIRIPTEPALPLIDVAIHRGRVARVPPAMADDLAGEIYSGLAEELEECIIAPLQSRGQNRCFRLRSEPQGCAKAEAGPEAGLSVKVDQREIATTCLSCPAFPIAGFLWADRGRSGRALEEDLLPLWFYLSQTDLLLEAAVLSEELQEAVVRDPLTGIHNRRHFLRCLEAEVERACRYGHPTTVVMIDVDRFGELNRRCGHAAGDQVLRGVAELIRTSIRRVDLLARYGNDELVLLLPHSGAEEARIALARLRSKIEQHRLGDGSEPVTFSAGIAVTPGDAPDAEGLMGLADYALHRAKQQGPGQTVSFGE
jgi:diguanylate cyclase (GGDEF)-like protein